MLWRAAWAAIILGLTAQSAYSFGPMNILTKSSGKLWSNCWLTPDGSPAIPLESAFITKSAAVLGSIHHAPIGGLLNTVIPVPAYLGSASIGSDLSIIFVSGTLFFMCKQPTIRLANHSASGTERSQNICTFILSGRPSNAALQFEPLRNRPRGIDRRAKLSSLVPSEMRLEFGVAHSPVT
jgi:hypothetical protein